MDRKEIFDGIVDAFGEKYQWLGKLFAREMLISIGCSKLVPPWRVQSSSRFVRHLLLFWKTGWLKSHLLKVFYRLFDSHQVVTLSNITRAKLEGSVYLKSARSGTFVVPTVLRFKYIIVTELGQLPGDVHQLLLNILEEGMLSVSLSKLSVLTVAQRRDIEAQFPIVFKDSQTLEYTSEATFFVATYDKKYLQDRAFSDRFVVVTPDEKRLDSALVKAIDRAEPVTFDDELVIEFRKRLSSDHGGDVSYERVQLPDEIYEIPYLSPRIANVLRGYKAGLEWWRKRVSTEELKLKLTEMIGGMNNIWVSKADRIAELISGSPLTAKEISKRLEFPLSTVYWGLKQVDWRAVNSSDGKRRYYVSE